MRIYDDKNKQTLKSVLIMLTPGEVKELIGSLKSLNLQNDHVHVDDENYQREITVGLYSPENLQSFHPDIIRIIQEE